MSTKSKDHRTKNDKRQKKDESSGCKEYLPPRTRRMGSVMDKGEKDAVSSTKSQAHHSNKKDKDVGNGSKPPPLTQRNDQMDYINHLEDEAVTGVTRNIHLELNMAFHNYNGILCGRTETTSDQNAATKIVSRFKALFEDRWDTLIRVYFNNEQMAGIDMLANIVQDCYEFCQVQADNQMKNILLSFHPFQAFSPDKSAKRQENFRDCSLQLVEKSINQVERDILKIMRRRTTNSSNYTEEVLMELFLKEKRKSLQEGLVFRFTSGKEELFLPFIKELIHCCWQVAIHIPELRLVFPDKDTVYDETLQRQFMPFDLDNKDILDGYETKKDCIFCVVWPACLGHDGSIYSQGDAVVVKKKRDRASREKHDKPMQWTPSVPSSSYQSSDRELMHGSRHSQKSDLPINQQSVRHGTNYDNQGNWLPGGNSRTDCSHVSGVQNVGDPRYDTPNK